MLNLLVRKLKLRKGESLVYGHRVRTDHDSNPDPFASRAQDLNYYPNYQVGLEEPPVLTSFSLMLQIASKSPGKFECPVQCLEGTDTH